MTKILHLSDVNILSEIYEKQKIYLFLQFFIPDNNDRYNEIKDTLKKNVSNTHISKIYMLNEKIYSNEELGINSDKIIQINVEKRLSFKMLFDYVKINKIKGIIVIANTDIFFDNTIQNVLKCRLSKQKAMYSLVRYEYINNNLKKCKLFGGGRGDSQDVWIIHSSKIPENRQNLR